MSQEREHDDVDLFGRRPKGRADWSHRRGEPRGLALAWSVYLMLVTLGSLGSALSLGRFEPDVYRPAARILMALVMVGVVLLWPMLRLTQASAFRSPGSSVVRDLVVVLLPAMTLVWPQVILADWPVEVVGALSALLVAWSLIAGSVLVVWCGARTESTVSRVTAMLVLVGLVLVWPLLLWRMGVLHLEPATLGVTPGWMWTPVSAVCEVLRDRGWSGRPARIAPEHWVWIVRLLIVSVGVFGVSVWSGRRGGPRLHDSPVASEH